MKWLAGLGAALALALAGCAGAAGPAGLTGTVTGSVTASRCRPVERLGDPPCPPRPNVQVDFTDSRSRTYTATTGPDGTYTIHLQPGSYSARARGGFGSAPRQVSVASQQTVFLDLTFDSGIR